MASIFDPHSPAGCPASPCGAVLVRDPSIYLSPQSESVESPEFEVAHGRAIVRAFDLSMGAIRIEMVHGHAEAKRFALAMQNGLPWLLTATHTVFVVEIPGRYRLVATGIPLGLQMPTIVVTDAPASRTTP